MRGLAWFLEKGVPILLRLGAFIILGILVGPFDWLKVLGLLAAVILIDISHGWYEAAENDPLIPKEGH